MADYNNRGGNRFGGNRFGKPSFGKKSWGDGRSDRPVTLHKATCAECGTTCEVPFRPVAGRPVYCKDCFGKKGGDRGGDRFPKRDFTARALAQPRFEGGGSSDLVTKQLEAVNAKLERLIQAVEALTVHNPVEAKGGLKKVLTGVLKKSSKKKAGKK